MKTVPFSIIPMPLLVKLSSRFRGFARMFASFFPNMDSELKQADMDVSSEDYITYVIISALANFFVLLGLFFLVWFYVIKRTDPLIPFVWTMGFLGFTIFMQLANPKVRISKRASEIEKTLLFALRNMLIRLKSGITLYESMSGVARQEFGLVSKEFKRTINEIESGIPQIEAIERMTFRNPSRTFRRIGWQISNGMKAGVSIQNSIESMVDNLMREHMIKIKNYGAQLNPLAMMYMMLTVVVPSLGITFLIILGSFFGFDIPENVFWMVALFLAIFQFIFMTIVKSRRPVVGI